MFKKLFTLSLIAISTVAYADFESASGAFSKEYSSRYERLETYQVSEVISEGIRCHVAVYSDAVIVTCLDGPEKGYQYIIQNGVIINMSNDMKKHKNYFEHKYNWGKVYSFPNRQYLQ